MKLKYYLLSFVFLFLSSAVAEPIVKRTNFTNRSEIVFEYDNNQLQLKFSHSENKVVDTKFFSNRLFNPEQIEYFGGFVIFKLQIMDTNGSPLGTEYYFINDQGKLSQLPIHPKSQVNVMMKIPRIKSSYAFVNDGNNGNLKNFIINFDGRMADLDLKEGLHVALFLENKDTSGIGVENFETTLENIIKHKGTDISEEPNLFFPKDKNSEGSSLPPLRAPNSNLLVPDAEGKMVLALSILRDFTTNYTLMLKNNPEEVIFNTPFPEELENLRIEFNKYEAGGVVVTGESGSGKTELIKEFIKNVVEGKFPEIHKDTVFLWVDEVALSAGTKYVGTYEARSNALFQYAKDNDVILILDETHSFRGSGASASSTTDFLDMLKPYLAKGSIKVLGTSTKEEYIQAISDPALRRRLPTIDKKSMSAEQMDKAIIQWAEKRKLNVLKPEARHRIATLAMHYDAVGSDFPKIIRLLDLVYATLKVKKMDSHSATITNIDNIASRAYNMDAAYFDNIERLSLYDKLKKGLDADIIGMPSLKNILLQETLIGLAELSGNSFPKMKLSLAGPPGVGKTYVSERYAHHLGRHFVRLVLPEYTPTKLLTRLGQELQKNAFTVFLIDEVEKAPAEVQNTLLNALDAKKISVAGLLQGHMVGSENATKIYTDVMVTNATFFLATNAGFLKGQSPLVEKLMEQSRLSELSDKELRDILVYNNFSEALLDRTRPIIIEPRGINETIEEARYHFDKKMALVAETFQKKYNVTVVVENKTEFLRSLVETHHTTGAGPREVLRQINNSVDGALSEAMLSLMTNLTKATVSTSSQVRCESIFTLGKKVTLPLVVPSKKGRKNSNSPMRFI